MNNIVLVGVGGAGVSAIARLFLSLGYTNLVGIDSTESELTLDLADKGLEVIIGHGSYDVQATDFLIYSAAAATSPEVEKSRSYIGENHKKVFPPVSYFQFLGEISKYFETVAVAGTHGKSTTTALTIHALSMHNPRFGLGIVGAGVADRDGANMKINESHQQDIKDIIAHITDPKGPSVEHLMKKHLFVIEACEYNYQFLSLDVDYAVITNIELDHADIYESFENYLDTFTKFCKKVHKHIFVFADTNGIDKIQGSTYTNITFVQKQGFNFEHMLGHHNHLNASLALAICTHLTNQETIPPVKGVTSGKADVGGLKKAIEGFTSLRRRGELLGHNKHGVPIITDYAHHPTELENVIPAVQEKYKTKEVKLIFQPHQARRVVEFWDEFREILSTLDNPIIYDIYTAREQIADLAEYNIVSKDLLDQVPDLATFDDLGNLFVAQCGGTYITDITKVQKILANTKKGVILIATAGDLDWEVRKRMMSIE